MSPSVRITLRRSQTPSVSAMNNGRPRDIVITSPLSPVRRHGNGYGIKYVATTPSGSDGGAQQVALVQVPSPRFTCDDATIIGILSRPHSDMSRAARLPPGSDDVITIAYASHGVFRYDGCAAKSLPTPASTRMRTKGTSVKKQFRILMSL